MFKNGTAAGLPPGALQKAGGCPLSPWMEQGHSGARILLDEHCYMSPLAGCLSSWRAFQGARGSLWPAGFAHQLDLGCGSHPPECLGPERILHLNPVMKLAALDPLQTHGVRSS